MSSTRVAILRNPASGTGLKRAEISSLVVRLREHGLRPRLFSRRERLAAWLAERHRRAELHSIVAAGGDGTVNDVVNWFPGNRLGVLPLGTENLLARYLAIPRSGRDVADLIAGGSTRTLDLGSANGRQFVMMASVGFDADVVHRTHRRRQGNITKLFYLQPFIEALRNYRYPAMRMFLDDSREPLSVRQAVVVNIPAYAFRLPVAPSARGDDGLLDLRLFQPRSAFQMLRYLFNVAVGRHESLADVESVQAVRIRVEAEAPVPVQVDGDPAGWTPVEIRILPAALTIYARQADSAASGGPAA